MVAGRKPQGYLQYRKSSSSAVTTAAVARTQLVVRSTASEQPRSAKEKRGTCQQLLLRPTSPYEHLGAMSLIQGLAMWHRGRIPVFQDGTMEELRPLHSVQSCHNYISYNKISCRSSHVKPPKDPLPCVNPPPPPRYPTAPQKKGEQ